MAPFAADTRARRSLAAALAVHLAVAPVLASAQDAMRAAGLAAQAEGRTLAEAFVPPTLEDGVLTLFPGTPGSATLPLSDLFPGSAGVDPSVYSGLYGESAGLAGAAQAAGAGLATEPTWTGEAYRAVVDSADSAHPDLRLDPVWRQTDETLTRLPELAASFADCSGTTTLLEATAQVHVPEYRTCERVEVPSLSACTATRQFATESRTTSAYLGVWGRDLNTFRFDLTNGAYGLVAPSDGSGAVGSVGALGAEFCGERPWRYRHVGTWDWVWGPDYDASYYHRILQHPTCASGLVGVVQLDDDGGKKWFRYGSQWQFQFSAVSEDRWSWSHPACPDLAARVGDGFCTGTLACTRNAGTSCIVADGIAFCGGEIAAPPVAGIEQGCLEIAVNAECRFNVGAMDCWVDPAGVTRCPSNAGGVATDCAALEADPACGFIKSTCVDGATGTSGACYVYEDTYDCGASVAVPTLERLARMDCAGPVRCMGDDCLLPETEQSADFARAAAALQAAQLMAMDGECVPADPGGGHYDVHGCTVFKGEARECKKAVGGIVDCCETPDGVSLGDYLTLVLAVAKLDSALTGLDAASPLRGAWETLRSPFTSAWGEISRPFTSVANNLLGTTAPAATDAAAESAVAAFEQAALRNTAEWVGATFGEAAGNALFSVNGGPAVAGGALQSGDLALGGVVGTAMSWLMTAYTVYSLAVLLVQMIWECEQAEFGLGAKRELKSCHALGSYCKSKVAGACIERRQGYCCFNSPLARILQEQVRPQLGLPWGDPENPACEGIPVERLSAVDWARVNLDEWLGILAQTGKLPSVANINPARLTGAGSALAIDGTRADVLERSRVRVEGVDAGPVREAVQGELWP
jgi:conjugal transfer mating pair stabilization protein TraN